MDKRFEKRLELAKNPRGRKRKGKAAAKFVRPASNVGAVIGELTGAGGDGRIYDPNPVRLGCNLAGAAFAPLLAAEHLAIAALQDGVEAVKNRMGKKERLENLEKRRTYYAAEALCRAARREQVRAAIPEPKNPCPTPEQLTEAYLHRRDSEAWQNRFGELMIDLEEHARREYAIAGNKFTGSAGGVKDWLKAQCPLLAAHYSTCQRYKRLAQEHSDTQVNG